MPTSGTAQIPLIHADNIIAQRPQEARHLEDLIRIGKVEEVVFCGADIELKEIISLMATLRTTGVDYKIAPAHGDYVIGSNSILSRESLFLDDLDTISTDACRRNKRLFDFFSALLLLLLSPILFWFQKKKSSYFSHCLQVLSGRCSWVGYRGRKGIFSPAVLAPQASAETQERLLLRYMRRYKTTTDAAILLKNWNKI